MRYKVRRNRIRLSGLERFRWWMMGRGKIESMAGRCSEYSVCCIQDLVLL